MIISNRKLAAFISFLFVTLPFLDAAAQAGAQKPSFQKAHNQQTDPKKKDPKGGDPVILSTGNLDVSKTDIRIPGRGMDFSFTRQYRSGTEVSSRLGAQWTTNWDRMIVLEPAKCNYNPVGHYAGPLDKIPCMKSKTVCSTPGECLTEYQQTPPYEASSTCGFAFDIPCEGTVFSVSVQAPATCAYSITSPAGTTWQQGSGGGNPDSAFDGESAQGPWYVGLGCPGECEASPCGTVCLTVSYYPTNCAAPCESSSLAATAASPTACQGSAFYYDGGSRIDNFTCAGTAGGWVSPKGYFSKLLGYGTLPGACAQQILPQYFVMRESDGTTLTFGESGSSPYVFGPCYFLTQIQDRMGNTIRVDYENAGSSSNKIPRISRVIDTLGRVIQFGYDAAGNLSTITDFAGRVYSYGHDSLGNLTSVTTPPVLGTSTGNNFPLGKKTIYTYGDPVMQPELANSLLTLIDANQVADGSMTPSLQNFYDNTGQRVIRQIYGGTDSSGVPAGGNFAFIYDELPSWAGIAPAKRTLMVDPNGNVQLNVFDKNGSDLVHLAFTGRVNAETVASGNYSIDQLLVGANPPAGTTYINPSAPGYEPPIRSTDPVMYKTTKEYNLDGQVIQERGPGYRIVRVYDENSPDVFQRGNLLREDRLPIDGSPGMISVVYAYEPFFNQLRASVDPRGLDASYQPPLAGPTSAARFLSENLFDYQESDGSALQAQLSHWGIDPAQATSLALLQSWGVSSLGPVVFSLGDQNGDGALDQIVGNSIVSKSPDAYIYSSPENPGGGSVVQQSVERTVAFNAFSLPIFSIDPEGNVTTFSYYPENNPDGDSQTTPNPVIGGQTIVLDPTAGSNGGGFLHVVQLPEGSTASTVYDALGRAKETTNPRGFVTTTEWNSLDQAVKVTDPRGYWQASIFDANDNVIRREIANVVPDFDSQGLPLGSETTLAPIVEIRKYDILDNLLQVDVQYETGNFLTTRHRYDKRGQRVLTLLPESASQPNNVTSWVYDELGGLWAETAGGVTSQFRSLFAHQSIVEAASIPDQTWIATNSHVLDMHRFLVKTIDPEGHETSYEYDVYGRKTLTTDPVGSEVRAVYDSASQLLDLQFWGDDGHGSFVQLSQTKYLYDELGRKFQEDRLLFPIASSLPVFEGPLTPGDGWITTRFAFDRNGRLVQSVDDNTNSQFTLYDGQSRVQRSTDAVGNYTEFTYDAAGNIVQALEHEVSSAGGPSEDYISRKFYDNLGRLVASVDPAGQTSRFVYDSRGNLVFASDAQGLGSLSLASLDLYGEFPGISGPSINGHGNTTISVFDDAGRVRSTTKHLRVGGQGGAPIDNTLSGDGAITTSRDYDRNSRLMAQTDDNGRVTSYLYDALNRRYKTIYANGSSEEVLQFDRDSNPLTTRDAMGSMFQLGYDPGSRLTSRLISPAAGLGGTTQQNFSYDGISRTVHAFDNNDPADANDDQSTDYFFDSLGRKLNEMQGTSPVQRSYDGVGNRLMLTYPDNRVISQTYDELNRVREVREGTTILASYEYLGGGRITRRDLGGGAVKLSRVFDGARRPISQTQDNSTGGLLAGFSYSYNRTSRKLYESRVHDGGKGRVWAYDSQYRIVNEKRDVANPPAESQTPGSGGAIGGQTSYTLDGAHNMTGLTENGQSHVNPVNHLNEYASFKGASQAHDANGNRTSDGAWSYQFDALGRLILVKKSGALVARYKYDSDNRRMEKILANGSGLRFVYNGIDLIEERDLQSDALIRQYVQGPGMDETLQLRRQPGSGYQDHFLLADVMGSTAAITNSSGAVLERVKYTAYGKPSFSSGSSSSLLVMQRLPLGGQPVIPSSSYDNPVLFVGRYYDAETGLYYNRNRFYDPEQGRFLSRDPIGVWGDSDQCGNPFSYGTDDPVNKRDPLGLWNTSQHVSGTYNFVLEKLGLSGNYYSHKYARPSRAYFEHGELSWESQFNNIALEAAMANKRVDQDQSSEGAYKHYMWPSKSQERQFRQLAENYVRTNLQTATDNLLGGNILNAARHFGSATHTRQDQAAPEHQDVWDGKPGSVVRHIPEIFRNGSARIRQVTQQTWNEWNANLSATLLGPYASGLAAERVEKLSEDLASQDPLGKLFKAAAEGRDAHYQARREIDQEVQRLIKGEFDRLQQLRKSDDPKDQEQYRAEIRGEVGCKCSKCNSKDEGSDAKPPTKTSG